MPSKVVQIEWDQPDDVNWLNQFNIELALSAYCRNTHFTVTDVEIGDDGPTGIGMLALIMEAVRREERKSCLDCIDRVRGYYPESVFTPDGTTIDAESARWARRVCDNIKDEIIQKDD